MNISERLQSESPQYRADFYEALKMLDGKPERTTIPVNGGPLVPYSAPVIPHDFNPDSIHDVLQRITIQRTTNPLLREVLFGGISIGRVAKNPYGLGWLASCNRRYLYWSQRDAALALYQEVRNA